MTRYTPENTSYGSVRVFVDGVEYKGVFEADDELGFIVIADLDDAGRYQVDEGNIKRKLVTGVVSVTIN